MPSYHMMEMSLYHHERILHQDSSKVFDNKPGLRDRNEAIWEAIINEKLYIQYEKKSSKCF